MKNKIIAATLAIIVVANMVPTAAFAQYDYSSDYYYTAPVTSSYDFTAPTVSSYDYTAPVTSSYDFTSPYTSSYNYTSPSVSGYDYTSPTVSGYNYTSPTVSSYDYTTPSYNYTSPTVTSYDYTSPVVTSYDYSSPVYTSYDYTSPTYTTPTYTSPTYTSPTYTSPTYVSPTYTTGSTYTGSTYTTGGGYTYTSSNPTTVTTTIICPTGSTLTNGQCINTVTGTVITTTTCPQGTTLNGTNCINTINGTVVTIINCPTGTTLTNGQCINTVTGNVITNTICPVGTILTNGQCLNTVTPPVTTITNCPSNTQFVNGVCQQIINPPVVVYQTCWDGSSIPATSICPAQYKVCANGTSIPVNQICPIPVNPTPIVPIKITFNNVVTSIATQVTNTSGRCNGIGLIANNAASTGWFEYGETANLGRTTASAQIGSSATAPFSNVLANLKPSTKYYCRAVMQNQYGIVKGEIVSFTTKSSATTYVKPVVITKKPTTKPTTTIKKNEILCADGSTVEVKNETAAALINKGEKLISLSVEKTDGKLVSGDLVRYKVSYKNLTDSRLTGVVVKVTLPQEIALSATTAGNYDEATRVLTLNQDTIDPYTEGTITITGNIVKDAAIGKTIVTNVYAVYTVPGTKTQDEVTAYIVGSITPASDTSASSTGAKKVVGASEGKGFMPNSLIEWLALLAILFIIFILGRSIYASYKEDGSDAHHH